MSELQCIQGRLTQAQWLGRQSFLDDLASLDPDLYNGLIFLKNYDGDFEALTLNFTVAVEGASCFQTVPSPTGQSLIWTFT